MVYYTRNLAKRLKTNREVEKWAVERAMAWAGYPSDEDSPERFWAHFQVARYMHPDHAWDDDADDDADQIIDLWVMEMKWMRNSFSFDVDVLRRLHPGVYMMNPERIREIERYHEKKAVEYKLNWVFSQLLRDPLVVNKL